MTKEATKKYLYNKRNGLKDKAGIVDGKKRCIKSGCWKPAEINPLTGQAMTFCKECNIWWNDVQRARSMRRGEMVQWYKEHHKREDVQGQTGVV